MSTQLSYLLIDAGNSRIKWALVEAQSGAQLAAGTFAHQATSAPATRDFPQLASAPDWSSLATPASAWISNVAGSTARANLEILLETRWPGLPRHFITAQASQCGIVNRYRDPAQLGSDRWAALIGAGAAYPGENLLLATFGTATTLEALHADGVFDGGLIVPGWSLMMQALGQRTAQLPELSAAEARALSGAREPNGPSSFARETAESMLDGCRLAQAALVEHAWQALGAQLNAPVRCVIGGGDAHLIAPALTIPYTRHDQLVLAGLALIAAAAP